MRATVTSNLTTQPARRIPTNAPTTRNDDQEEQARDGHHRHRGVVVDAVEHLGDQRELGGAPRDVPSWRRTLLRFAIGPSPGGYRPPPPDRPVAQAPPVMVHVATLPVTERSVRPATLNSVIHDPRRVLPEGWARATSRGFGPFTTELTLEGRDGVRAVWSSRHHRKRSSSPIGSTWWAPRAIGWWMGVLFAIGSACFAVAASPPSPPRSGPTTDNAIYFIGSIFFTTAGLLQYGQVVGADDPALAEPGTDCAVWPPGHPTGSTGWRQPSRPLGTVFFNISTGHALTTSATSRR